MGFTTSGFAWVSYGLQKDFERLLKPIRNASLWGLSSGGSEI